MTTDKRVPKLGEVWTGGDGVHYTCIDDQPDKIGRYGWSTPSWHDDGSVLKEYRSTVNLTPPRNDPPEWLTAAPWHAVHKAGALGYAGWIRAIGAITYADPYPHGEPVGAINVITGEWVPA